GDAYRDGNGLPQNDDEAARWYRSAAEQGNSDAQSSLSFLYAVGRGVNKDFSEAAKWYRKAARQGNAVAMFNLAAMYCWPRRTSPEQICQTTIDWRSSTAQKR